MPLFAAAGSKVYIGGAKASTSTDFVASDFDSETWTEIDGLENIGTFGDAAQTITSSLINRGRDVKQKGTRNAGTMDLIVALNYADAGQLALIAAEKSPNEYAFRVDFNDAPEGGSPSQRFFVGLVMSASEELGEANNTIKLNASLEINSNIVRVAASA